jgi:hypothetical protein
MDIKTIKILIVSLIENGCAFNESIILQSEIQLMTYYLRKYVDDNTVYNIIIMLIAGRWGHLFTIYMKMYIDKFNIMYDIEKENIKKIINYVESLKPVCNENDIDKLVEKFSYVKLNSALTRGIKKTNTNKKKLIVKVRNWSL